MYVKIVDNAIDRYPYTLEQLRKDNPSVSFPKVMSDNLLESYGIYIVTQLNTPSINKRTQKYTANAAPTLVDGAWTIGWTTSNKSSDEISVYDNVEAATNRSTRNNLLYETDYYGNSDVTMPDNVKTYRQALRDLPTHSNWPNLQDSDWPTKP